MKTIVRSVSRCRGCFHLFLSRRPRRHRMNTLLRGARAECGRNGVRASAHSERSSNTAPTRSALFRSRSNCSCRWQYTCSNKAGVQSSCPATRQLLLLPETRPSRAVSRQPWLPPQSYLFCSKGRKRKRMRENLCSLRRWLRRHLERMQGRERFRRRHLRHRHRVEDGKQRSVQTKGVLRSFFFCC